MVLNKVSETSTTITLGWAPPTGVGGYVFYSNGQVASVATARLKDGTLRKEVKFSKTSPGPPFQVAAVCRSAVGGFSLDVGTYTLVAPLPPNSAISEPTTVVTA